MIGVGNYVIVSPSELGNYKIADILKDPQSGKWEARQLVK